LGAVVVCAAEAFHVGEHMTAHGRDLIAYPIEWSDSPSLSRISCATDIICSMILVGRGLVLQAASVLGAECKSPPAVMASNRMSPRALGCYQPRQQIW